MAFLLNKIGEQWNIQRSLDQHMKDLKRKLEELEGLKEDTESRIRTELQQPRKKLKTEVHKWLYNVERIKGEVEDLDGRIGESSTFTRGFNTKHVLKSIREVDQLIQQGRFHEGLVLDNPQWIGQVLSTSSLTGEAAKACVEVIWQCLMDDEVIKIGVWGMGGVGKTSIMKVINNQLLNMRDKFNVVIWITVSKEMSVAKLQKDIASKVGVNFSGDEDEITRAGMLFEALSRKNSFVMILDDLWENVSLERLGIPELSNGTKLVLTTRSRDVCQQMGCKIIKVKPLGEREAWNLFSEKVGRDILNIPGLEPIAKSIAKHCAGLPLGLITVATCMKGIDDLSEWRNALNELVARKRSVNGLEGDVFQQLAFSYQRLRDLKIQHCFLSCALYPEDFEICESDLVQLWIAEELLDEMGSRQANFDRGHVIMNRLINNCLLEVFSEKEYGRFVKMHDLVREMALHITKAEPRFFVKSGMGLTKPPDVQEWSKVVEKVSLMWNFGLRVLYPLEMSPPKCPMLTTLLLSDCGITSIPEGFFKHMGKLRILDLSRNHMRRLPESISNLENLTTLLLHWCASLKKVPSLSNLRGLKKLDLEGTQIKEVPHGVQNLFSLKYLSLTSSYNLHEIPNGMLSRLSCLQELTVDGKAALSGKEVGGLEELEILEGRFVDIHNLNMFAQALCGRKELDKYMFLVSPEYWFYRPQIRTRKYIGLWGCDIYTDHHVLLPRDIEELTVGYCNVYNCEEWPLFSRSIQVSLGTFSSLKFLDVFRCRNFKRLFSPSCFPLNLEELKVGWCHEPEEIFAAEAESVERGMVTVGFPVRQLKKLELEDLPKLKSICSVDGGMVCDSLEEIRIVNCPELKRMPFKYPQFDNVQPFAPLSLSVMPMEWWESVEWDHPHAKSLFRVKECSSRDLLNC